jgi:beta-glucosidase
VFGDYPETMKTNVGSRLPAFTEEESEQVKGAFDFVGVINYMALYVKDNSSSLKPNLQDFNTDIAVEMTLVGNTSIENEYANTPWSLQQILLYVKETYGNPPVYILENGLSLSLSASLRL